MQLDLAQLAVLAGTPTSLGLVASWIAARRVLARRLGACESAWQERLDEAVARASQERSEAGPDSDPAGRARLEAQLAERDEQAEALRARIAELEAVAPAPVDGAPVDGAPVDGAPAEAAPAAAADPAEIAALRVELEEWQQRYRGLQVLQRQAEDRARALEAGGAVAPTPQESGENQAATEDETIRLRARLEATLAERDALQDRCRELEERPAEAPTGAADEFAEMRALLARRETDLAHTREELAEARREAECRGSEVADSGLRGELDAARAERDRLAEEERKFRAAFRGRERDLVRVKHDLGRLRGELEEAETHGSRLSEVNEKLYAFQQELMDRIAALESERGSADPRRAERERLERDVVRERRERERLEAALAEARAHGDQLGELNERLYAFQSELLAANSELEAKTQRIGRLVTPPSGERRAG